MYAIVDVETTGNHKGADRIIEIAIIISDGEKIVDEFQSLVNPEKSINPFVEKLTGIHQRMVANSPKFSEIAAKVFDMLHGKMFVAHNVAFDYALIEGELASCGIGFDAPQIDTITFAKRIFHGLQSYSLGNLCDAIGVPHGDRHRAYGDTLATTQLFHMLMARDTNGASLTAILQHGLDERCLPKNLAKETVLSLPTSPGIIKLFTSKGELVSVEASKNIRKKAIDKIQQLFNDLTDKSIFHEIAEIEYRATGNELIAKILREKTLHESTPLIGKIAKRYALSHALVLEQNSMGLNLIKARHISEIDGRSYIPFSSKTYANKTLERIMTKGNFHNSYESVITEKNPELQSLKQSEYNLRIHQALLTSTYLYPNMIIVDKGSSSDEYTLVWIHNGQYKGYGFITSDSAITKENVSEFITPDTEYPEIQKAIKNYLKKSKVVKLIRY